MMAITEAFYFSAYMLPAEVAEFGGDAQAKHHHGPAPPDNESTRESDGGVPPLLQGTSDRIPSFLPCLALPWKCSSGLTGANSWFLLLARY